MSIANLVPRIDARNAKVTAVSFDVERGDQALLLSMACSIIFVRRELGGLAAHLGYLVRQYSRARS